MRKILKIEFHSILALIFLCKSCVNLDDFAYLENLDFVNSWIFKEFLKLRMIHPKLGICRIDHYLNFCQMNYRNFASKQKFAFLNKIEILSNFYRYFLCKSCVKWCWKSMKSQFFSKRRIFVLKQNFDNWEFFSTCT